MAMLFSDKKIILVLSFIFSQPCFPFAFSLSLCSLLPGLLLTSACVLVCMCVIVQLPNNRLRWSATNYAEDQGEAWNCIRKASGLYVPLFSSQTTSLLSSVFQVFLWSFFFFLLGSMECLFFVIVKGIHYYNFALSAWLTFYFTSIVCPYVSLYLVSISVRWTWYTSTLSQG